MAGECMIAVLPIGATYPFESATHPRNISARSRHVIRCARGRWYEIVFPDND